MGTVSTTDFVNLANQLACSVNESPERKTAKMLSFQVLPMKVALQTPNLVFAMIAKSQDSGKGSLQT